MPAQKPVSSPTASVAPRAIQSRSNAPSSHTSPAFPSVKPARIPSDPQNGRTAVRQETELTLPTAGPSRLGAHLSSSTSKGKAPQIISSLFSSNPIPSTIPFSSTLPSIGAPSNAPLTGDTNTFSGLGLDPLLVHHLTTKMDLKMPTAIQRSALPFMLSEPLEMSKATEEDDDSIQSTQQALSDIFIQSQTGSGKTLTYLLPIIQTLLPLSKLSHIDRSVGTLAIVIAPTRELAKQIEKVLNQILSMALSLRDSDNEEQYTRWLVSGLLTGGSTRTHEKARLRRGVPILVSTPGRLLDHLQNTSRFQCAKTLFLVLDEADRLMDLGFEETIRGIIKALDGRRRLEIAAEKHMDEVGGGTMRWPFWDRGRRTVLCSATVDAKVERLSDTSLQNPIVFRAVKEHHDRLVEQGEKATEKSTLESNPVELPKMDLDKFTPPSQLAQKYVIVPTKLRLVALVSVLRLLVASVNEGGNKVIVFLSSTDAVDFHWQLLGGVRMVDSTADSHTADTITLKSPLFPKSTLQRLHGSLPLATRRSSLAAFAAPSTSPAILLATSVASRGLDLPLIRAVVQYDLPTEGGANEYVHRVGRTARAGQGGEAWAFVGPAETGWVPWVEGKMGAVGENGAKLGQVGIDEVLRKGFGGKGYEFETRATEVQLALEGWVLGDDQVCLCLFLLLAYFLLTGYFQHAVLARRAFASFVRAYSTHSVEEKAFFHPRSLHLGHLAKAFALREAPSTLAGSHKSVRTTTQLPTGPKRKRPANERYGAKDENVYEVKGGKEKTARNDTERRMYEAVRKAGRAVKSGGAMGEYAGKRDDKRRGVGGGRGAEFQVMGGAEFQVMGGDEMEQMVSRR